MTFSSFIDHFEHLSAFKKYWKKTHKTNLFLLFICLGRKFMNVRNVLEIVVARNVRFICYFVLISIKYLLFSQVLHPKATGYPCEWNGKTREQIYD